MSQKEIMETRVIKFRAWDRGVGYFVDDFLVSADGILMSEDGGQHPRRFYMILTQFTGLYDENGKEIYEGDIVEGKKKGDFGVVIYMAPQFVVDPLSDHIISTLGDGRVGIKKLEYTQVVGNIYENPELLVFTPSK